MISVLSEWQGFVCFKNLVLQENDIHVPNHRLLYKWAAHGKLVKNDNKIKGNW